MINLRHLPNTHRQQHSIKAFFALDKKLFGQISAETLDHISAHTLRPSFATHQLEKGTDVSYIQELLGHGNSKTTKIDTRVSQKSLANIKSPLDHVIELQSVDNMSYK